MTTGYILSNPIPVVPAMGYLLYAEFKGTYGETAGIRVYWYQADRVTPASPASTTRTEGALGGRNFMQEIVEAPSDAKWARLSPYRSSGTHDMFFFDTDLKEMLPAFRVVLNLNQAIASQGAAIVEFDTQVFDATDSVLLASHYFQPRCDGLYRVGAMVRVYAADDSQVPSYIDLYDTVGATVLAVGGIEGAVANHVAHFHVDSGDIWLTNEQTVKVRYHAFGACTVYASGSWFAGRQLL